MSKSKSQIRHTYVTKGTYAFIYSYYTYSTGEPLVPVHTVYVYIQYTLSPDAERSPSRLLAHTGARYEISNLREIYGAGTRNTVCSSGGFSSGVGAQSASFRRPVRRALAPRRSSPETRGVPSSGAEPSENGTCSGGGICRKIRAGRSTEN